MFRSSSDLNPKIPLFFGNILLVSLIFTQSSHSSSQIVLKSAVSPDISISGTLPFITKISCAIFDLMYDSRSNQSSYNVFGGPILLIFRAAPRLSLLIAASAAFCQGK